MDKATHDLLSRLAIEYRKVLVHLDEDASFGELTYDAPILTEVEEALRKPVDE